MKKTDLALVIYDGVYTPSEDTYLLLDAIDLDHDDVFLEVGCGTGLVSVIAAKICRHVVALDISLPAVRNTQKNIHENGLTHRCNVVQSDLLTSIDERYSFSVIAFNPPYLPKDGTKTSLDGSLIGGETGAEITIRFLKQAARHLIDEGHLYFVASTLGSPETIEMQMGKMDMMFEVVSKEHYFYEDIFVYKAKISKN